MNLKINAVVIKQDPTMKLYVGTLPVSLILSEGFAIPGPYQREVLRAKVDKLKKDFKRSIYANDLIIESSFIYATSKSLKFIRNQPHNGQSGTLLLGNFNAGDPLFRILDSYQRTTALQELCQEDNKCQKYLENFEVACVITVIPSMSRETARFNILNGRQTKLSSGKIKRNNTEIDLRTSGSVPEDIERRIRSGLDKEVYNLVQVIDSSSVFANKVVMTEQKTQNSAITYSQLARVLESKVFHKKKHPLVTGEISAEEFVIYLAEFVRFLKGPAEIAGPISIAIECSEMVLQYFVRNEFKITPKNLRVVFKYLPKKANLLKVCNAEYWAEGGVGRSRVNNGRWEIIQPFTSAWQLFERKQHLRVCEALRCDS